MPARRFSPAVGCDRISHAILLFPTTHGYGLRCRMPAAAHGAAAYSTIRFVEAYGLFRERTWAEVLAAVSAALYLPFELVEVIRHPTIMHGALLIANAAVVYIMVFALSRKRASRAAR